MMSNSFPSDRVHNLLAGSRYEVMPTARIHEDVLAHVPREVPVTVTAAQNKGLDLAVVDYFELNDAGLIKRARAFWDEGCVGVPAGMEIFAPNVDEAHTK